MSDSLRPRRSGAADGGGCGAENGHRRFHWFNSTPHVDLSVTVGGRGAPDASVELNGSLLTYDLPSGHFRLNSGAPQGAVVAGGDNVLTVTASGASVLRIDFFMPGDFAVIAPMFGARLQSGAAFDVAWTESKDAGSYGVSVYRANPFGPVFDRAGIASPLTVPAISYQGGGTVTVRASMGPLVDGNGSFIHRYVNQSIPVTIE